MSGANEGHPPSPCWAVFQTKAWGEKIEERQQSIPLPKDDAKAHIDVLRRMHHGWGHRYRMRKLPNSVLGRFDPPNTSQYNKNVAKENKWQKNK